MAASLHRGGVPVHIATTNDAVREVWTTTGPYLGGSGPLGPLPAASVQKEPADFGLSFSTIFLAVQPPQLELVTRQTVAVLDTDGRIVCLSNGLCEEHMSELIDEDLVVGAVVSWGARMKAPGHYTRTSGGGFRVGKLSGLDDARLDDIERILSFAGRPKRTSNLRGARFAKLTINCAVTALGTIGGQTLGQLLVRTRPRSLALALMRECAEVAAALDVRMEPVTKLDLGKLASVPKNSKTFSKVATHALLLAAGTRYRKLRSSMLAAMERGREPAIDFINGEVVRLGKQCGVKTPYNRAATEVVWEIYRGDLRAGNEALLRVEELARKYTPLEALAESCS